MPNQSAICLTFSSVESDSERDVESEEDVDSDVGSDPYPFEGKYIDEEDKQRFGAL